MFGRKVRIEAGLYDRVAAAAKRKGYASVEEFVAHVLEKAAAEADEKAGEEEVRKRLQGLGYLG